MSEERAGPEKKQSQGNMRLLRMWYRAMHIPEDEIFELTREPAAGTESTTVRARRK
jgi:hypothetical protein